MTNVVRSRRLNCIDWTVQTSASSLPLVSEGFTFQDRKCHLEFTTGNFRDFTSYHPSYLYFKCNEELRPSVKVVTCGSTALEALGAQMHAVNGPNKIYIWKSSANLTNSLLTFEIYIREDPSKDDKSVQISSYQDAGFSMENLSQDYFKLFDEGPNHDVEFKCGDQTIKAHKNILCCRSKVFASMLQSDMVEAKTGRVEIKDMDATIFQQLLRCLYTGMLPKLTVDSASQFYEASDRYGVLAVRKQCGDFLVDNLSPENACDILVLSDRHSDVDFKKNVIEYIIEKKIPYVAKKWKGFCRENPVLAVEVYELFCEQLRPQEISV